MKWTKLIIPVGLIKVLGITQPSVQGCMELCLKVLFHMQEPIDSIVAHDKKLPSYEYDESSIGDRLIPKHVTTG